MATEIDVIYDALCKTCDVLDEISCDYFLAGGTLLGALREGDLIPHDIDFDLDCLVKDEESILAAKNLFEANGLTIRRKLTTAPRKFDTLRHTDRPLNASCIVVEYEGKHLGDIFIFTIFSDGIARRFDLIDGVYANSKMSIPAWYYSGDEFLEIRGRRFRSVRCPDLVLEKIYGEDWRYPLKPGQFQEGRNKTSGSVPDADIEKLIFHAIQQGWSAHQPNAPKWPQPIQWVAWPTDVGFDWIVRHEPMIHPAVCLLLQDGEFLDFLKVAEDSQKQALLRILVAKAIQSENLRARMHSIRMKSQQTLAKRIYHALDIPVGFRRLLIRIYNLIKKLRE